MGTSVTEGALLLAACNKKNASANSLDYSMVSLPVQRSLVLIGVGASTRQQSTTA